jgi:hypothetical protein
MRFDNVMKRADKEDKLFSYPLSKKNNLSEVIFHLQFHQASREKKKARVEDKTEEIPCYFLK